MPGCKDILVAVTGASGVVYAERFLEIAVQSDLAVKGVIVTDSALNVARIELGRNLRVPSQIPIFQEKDFTAPFASSSGVPGCMVIVPASMNTISKIATGLQDNLVTRAAASILRLGRRLIVVPRETPLGVAELENMVKLARRGVIVLPASPGFYGKPRSIDDLIDFIAGKIFDVLGIANNLYDHWMTKTHPP
ncbi:MAG: UbiX family flavin prenyltransferase [Desulfurococcales archaeon]|nr:UbiX family flavin prenyltransferase [Desulfurococcales archaeon]